MVIVAYLFLVLLLLLFVGALVNRMMKQRTQFTRDRGSGSGLSGFSSDKARREEHFTWLVKSITPVWYWRVNHEYTDFINATINKMNVIQITGTPGLFEAQRRCSLLNAAIYNYYASIKKRCLDGEYVAVNDLEILNMRHAFDEFTFSAYPHLVSLVWPEFRRPQLFSQAA